MLCCCLIGMPGVYKGVVFVLGLFSAVFGVWLMQNPKRAIEFQIAVYRSIHWKMEPLDWPREVRNTRIMGVIALACGLATLFLTRRWIGLA